MTGRWTLDDVAAAVRASWGVDVCEDPVDARRWSPATPARGQCGPTALVVHDLVGGRLCLAEVRLPDGSQRGVHWWNRLPDGREVDLTREQFDCGETLTPPRVLDRPSGPMRRGEAEYRLLRQRVLAVLTAADPGPA